MTLRLSSCALGGSRSTIAQPKTGPFAKYPHWRLVLMAVAQAVLGLSDQYWTQSLNQVEPFVRSFIQNSAQHNNDTCEPACEEWTWSTITSASMFSSFVTALLLETSLTRWGNKFTLTVVHNSIQITAGVLGFAALHLLSVPLFVLARILMGAAEVSAIMAPVYVAECSPDNHRGSLSAVVIVGMVLWAAFCTLSEMPEFLGTSALWSYICLVPVVPAILHLCVTPWFPESPRYLYITKRDPSAALRSARFYNGDHFDSSEMFASFDEEIQTRNQLSQTKVRWSDIFKLGKYRKPFVLVLVISASITFGGIDIIGNYSTGELQQLGLSYSLSTKLTLLYIQGTSVTAILLALFLIERVGRRCLFLLGLIMGTIAMTSLMMVDVISQDKYYLRFALLSLAIILSATAYSIGPSLIGVIITAEVCPQASRSKTYSAGIAMIWCWAILSAFFYPPLSAAIGNLAVSPLVLLGVCSTWFVYKHLPETKGRSLNDIQAIWDSEWEPDERTSLIG